MRTDVIVMVVKVTVFHRMCIKVSRLRRFHLLMTHNGHMTVPVLLAFSEAGSGIAKW